MRGWSLSCTDEEVTGPSCQQGLQQHFEQLCTYISFKLVTPVLGISPLAPSGPPARFRRASGEQPRLPQSSCQTPKPCRASCATNARGQGLPGRGNPSANPRSIAHGSGSNSSPRLRAISSLLSIAQPSLRSSLSPSPLGP